MMTVTTHIPPLWWRWRAGHAIWKGVLGNHKFNTRARLMLKLALIQIRKIFSRYTAKHRSCSMPQKMPGIINASPHQLSPKFQCNFLPNPTSLPLLSCWVRRAEFSIRRRRQKGENWKEKKSLIKMELTLRRVSFLWEAWLCLDWWINSRF